jgi:glycosyltransferase involved in cell wall biosynthesis
MQRVPPFPLSVAIVSQNEETRIGRCLESVRGLAREIVVVDGGSTDGTRAVAERHGARWIVHPWAGYRDQKNFALDQCAQPWVLALDCDEELSPALRAEVERFLAADGGGLDGAAFPRLSRFLGRWIRHGDWYPDLSLRLFRRARARWGGSPEHDKIELDGNVARLRGDLLHHSFPTLNRYIGKINVFGDAFLERQLETGARWRLAPNLARPLWRFLRGYVLRLGFLDGFPGLWIAVASSFLVFVRYSRLYEHETATRDPGGREGGDECASP